MTEGVQGIQKIKDTAAQVKELANRYYTTRPDLVKRLFLGLPYEITIPGINKKIKKYQQGVYSLKDIYDVISHVPESDKKTVINYVIALLRRAIKHEIIDKKIPLTTFENGAISYGMCDKIAYFGQHYLSMCILRSKALELEQINWVQVKIEYLVSDLDEILKDKYQPSLKEIANFYPIYTRDIQNYSESEHKIIFVDKAKFPFAVVGASISYKDLTLNVMLDIPSIKATSQYFVRPMQMMAIKAQKALCKVLYANHIDLLGIYDGGEEEENIVEALEEKDVTEKVEVKLIDAKEDFALNEIARMKNTIVR